MMVPMEGVEPTHSCEYQILSLARLPVPPHRHCLLQTTYNIQHGGYLTLCHNLCHCYAVKLSESVSSGSIASTVNSSGRSHAAGTYQRVTDSRKRPIRGLWIRNGKFYARLAVQDQATGRKQVRRVRLKQEIAGPNGEKTLEDITTLADALKALQKLKTKRDDNDLPTLRRTPKFSEYVTRYLDFHRQIKDGKRPDTLETERSHLNAWVEHLGETRLDLVDRTKINGFIAKRQADGVSGRTVNLAVTVLRNVLNHAIDEQWIKRLPTENLRPLKWTP